LPRASHTTNDSGRLRVLGIDPGLANVGYGVIDWHPDRSQGQVVEYGVIQTRVGDALPARLEKIHDQLTALVERLKPSVAAIEQIYFARNVKTAMVVAHGRAACVLATSRRRLEVVEYTPLQIKQALTGHGRAAKRQVQMMVRSLLNLDQMPRPDHAADALATALCHVHSLALNKKIEQAHGDTDNGRPEDAEDPRKALLASRRRKGRRRR